jgi:hypothetical protein
LWLRAAVVLLLVVVVQVGLEQEQVKVLLLELNTQLLLVAVVLDRLLLVALGEPMEVTQYFLPLHLPVAVEVGQTLLIQLVLMVVLVAVVLLMALLVAQETLLLLLRPKETTGVLDIPMEQVMELVVAVAAQVLLDKL